MSTCISCMNTRDPPGKRGGTAIQLQLVLPLCLLPRVLLRQPELLRIFILHLHCTFPLLFSYCCLIFYLLLPLLFLLASLDLLLLLPCLVLHTVLLLLTPFLIFQLMILLTLLRQQPPPHSHFSPFPFSSLAQQTFCLGTLQMLQISCPLLGCSQELAKCKPGQQLLSD